MLTTDLAILEAYKSPVRHVEAEIVVYDGDSVKTRLAHNTVLKSFTIERVGETNKFFGFGICQKANVKVMDVERNIDMKAGNSFTIDIKNGGNALRPAPRLYITEIHRDEITNELSITAYDRIYEAAAHTTSELEVELPATIAEYAVAAGNVLGLNVSFYAENEAFNLSYEEGANLDGTESIRSLLDAIAEATQTIYYISRYNTLIFKTLDKTGAAAYTIDKEQYMNLESGENRRLAAICSTNELGNSVEAKLDVSGTTQYVRDNPFYELREDIAAIVEAALDVVGGFTINQFECEWRGNPAVEVGDKIAFITKDNEIATTYLLDDILTYDGTLSQRTQWRYEDSSSETENNPSNLGEAINKTFARVDKVNQQIDIVAGEAQHNTSSIAALQLNTESIQASVNQVRQSVDEALDGVNTDMAVLTNKVEAAMTAEGVKISIQEELAKGVDKVYTTTGFSFDSEGLRVSKTGSEMESLLDEDGLKVYRDDVEVLTANNMGVNGINMTVRQYLIVGGSRFEAYGAGRTGCFWIG